MKVVSEEEVEVTDEFKGRIGAQTAKQVIFQKLRDAEREMTYEEFAGPRGRHRHGHRPAAGAPLHAARPGQGRGVAAAGRAGAVRAVPPRRAPEGVHHRGPQGHEGPADRRVALAPRAAEGAVRAGGARDRGGHRRDQGGGARARAPLEDRGVVERARRRPGRRVRRPEGVARPHGRERAARREDRRRAVEREPRASSSPTRCSRRR